MKEIKEVKDIIDFITEFNISASNEDEIELYVEKLAAIVDILKSNEYLISPFMYLISTRIRELKTESTVGRRQEFIERLEQISQTLRNEFFSKMNEGMERDMQEIKEIMQRLSN